MFIVFILINLFSSPFEIFLDVLKTDTRIYNEAKTILAEQIKIDKELKEYESEYKLYEKQNPNNPNFINLFIFNMERKAKNKTNIYEIEQKYREAQNGFEKLFTRVGLGLSKKILESVNKKNNLLRFKEILSKQKKEYQTELSQLPEEMLKTFESKNKAISKEKLFLSYSQFQHEAFVFYNKANNEAKIEAINLLDSKLKTNQALNMQELEILNRLHIEYLAYKKYSSFFNIKGHINNSLYIYGVIIVKEVIVASLKNIKLEKSNELYSFSVKEDQTNIVKNKLEEQIKSLISIESIPSHIGFLSFGFATDALNRTVLEKIYRKGRLSKVLNKNIVSRSLKLYGLKSFTRSSGMIFGMYVSHVVTSLLTFYKEFFDINGELISSINSKYNLNLKNNEEILKLSKKAISSIVFSKDSKIHVLLAGITFEIAHIIIDSLKYKLSYNRIMKNNLSDCEISLDLLIQKQIQLSSRQSLGAKRALRFTESVTVFTLADFIHELLFHDDNFFNFNKEEEEHKVFDELSELYLESISAMIYEIYSQIKDESIDNLKGKFRIEPREQILKELEPLNKSIFASGILYRIAKNDFIRGEDSCLNNSSSQEEFNMCIYSRVLLEDRLINNKQLISEYIVKNDFDNLSKLIEKQSLTLKKIKQDKITFEYSEQENKYYLFYNGILLDIYYDNLYEAILYLLKTANYSVIRSLINNEEINTVIKDALPISFSFDFISKTLNTINKINNDITYLSSSEFKEYLFTINQFKFEKNEDFSKAILEGISLKIKKENIDVFLNILKSFNINQ